VISTTIEGYNLGRKYDFRADSIEDMWSWINGIRTAVVEAHKLQAALEAVRSPPPLPTVAPTRVPTVRSLPPCAPRGSAGTLLGSLCYARQQASNRGGLG
jgi:hypothetical protein